jgi:hypothetical protein
MNPRHVVLSNVETLEDFSKYAIDVDGNLWSLQYKYPKLRKPVMSGGYLSVKLRDDYKNLKTFYIHKLVALAFLPTDNIERGVRHKNKDRTDNRLENIEWIVRKDQREQANDYGQDLDEYTYDLDEDYTRDGQDYQDLAYRHYA